MYVAAVARITLMMMKPPGVNHLCVFGVDTRDGHCRLHETQPRIRVVRIKVADACDVERLLHERRYDEALEAMLDLYEGKSSGWPWPCCGIQAAPRK
jgi:hypothetical protein